VLDHPEDRENVWSGSTGRNWPSAIPSRMVSATRKLQRPVIRDNHPVKPPSVGHHFPLDQARIRRVAHDKIKSRVHQRADAFSGRHRKHFWRFHSDTNLGYHRFEHEAYAALPYCEINSKEVLWLIRVRAIWSFARRRAPAEQNFSVRQTTIRRTVANWPLFPTAAADGRKLPFAHEVRLSFSA